VAREAVGYIIYYLAVLRDYNNLILRQILLLILGVRGSYLEYR
jgi:hypothetical protein